MSEVPFGEVARGDGDTHDAAERGQRGVQAAGVNRHASLVRVRTTNGPYLVTGFPAHVSLREYHVNKHHLFQVSRRKNEAQRSVTNLNLNQPVCLQNPY